MMMTAKQAFKLADSIMRYENCRYDGEDYLPNKFNYGRDVRAEIRAIPNGILGTTYKWYLEIGTVGWGMGLYLASKPGRIMEMYNEKLHDHDLLVRGWHVQRPNGYGLVGGRTVLKRIKPQAMRVT